MWDITKQIGVAMFSLEVQEQTDLIYTMIAEILIANKRMLLGFLLRHQTHYIPFVCIN